VAQTQDALLALQVAITLVPAAILGLAVIGLIGVYRPVAARMLAQAQRDT
jgi:GPH family glycoside/pentoside/hexuronide:cation symporter